MLPSVQELASILPGKLIAGNGARILSGKVDTDSRKVSSGSLFFALGGEQFDGNDFALQAAENGAAALVLSRPVPGLPDSCDVLLVEDTLRALQNLAKWKRMQLDDLRVVGITGSNGKTSTKDFTRSILAEHFNTIGTSGNLNNHIGVPLSILSANDTHEAAVWEIGMNHPGELAPLCDMIRPEIGIITCIGTAHIEFMRTREAIAEEKAVLARALPEQGTLIYPSRDDFADFLHRNTRARSFPVGGEHDAVKALDIRPTKEGSSFTLSIQGQGDFPVSLHVPGRHMVGNALLAAAAGISLGLSPEQIVQGLSRARLSGGRLRQFTHGSHTVIDDSYNANPDSMIAALETLATTSLPPGSRRIAVLGKMGELGEFAREGHERVGVCAGTLNIDCLIVVGEDARDILRGAQTVPGNMKTLFFSDKQEAAEEIRSLLSPGDALLFKGSRSAAMEEIMNTLFPTTPEHD